MVRQITNLITEFTDLSEQEIERLLALPPRALYDDPVYVSVLTTLDVATLRQTLPYAREVYDEHLQQLKERHNLGSTVMSGHTLGSALVGFVMQPDRLPELLDKHALLSAQTIRATLPDLVDLLGEIEEGAEQWQTAMVILSLPLMARTDGHTPHA
jgi:hypothetical protein